ncbi:MULTISPECIES: nuclear transport factor 2 family protein [Streptomycetaceae]|nr:MULTISPECIES: nuclear transport factor 2 family protein [Streptomycetaceae]MYS60637.1 hypothetical protein [Streptomyces sp. SID5468]CCB76445.1 conserved protein of unknown function [Streptantibioticus cattleyicolor NRRL 8057 = DSM 46488]
MSDTAETRAVVEEFFRRVRDGEPETVGDLFAERIDWYIYGSDAVPWVGRRTTREEAGQFYTELRGHLETKHFTCRHIVADGVHAVALGDMEQLVKSTGKIFASPFAFHFVVENGLITRYLAFEDSLALARAFNAAD